MKKILLCTMIIAFCEVLSSNIAFSAMNYYQAPNAGNMNFYPMMQRQKEKEETLDFINNPEDYKKKREAKDAKLDYQEGKTDINPYLTPARININANKFQTTTPSMEFTKDENGQIKIQGIK